MFLADTAIDLVWDSLDDATRSNGRFLDPACGSGLFLVKSFQRMCDHWRSTHGLETIRWNSLLHMLSRLAGCDIDSGAVRVAVFSLYVALLEEVQPPDIRGLIGKGNLLPSLWDESLCAQDFFDRTTEDGSYDVIIGNPPWSSRRGSNRSAVDWCKRHFKPMPGQESAWGFAWKSLLHVRDSGIVGFVLPAMGFLHNHAATSVTARKRFTSEVRVRLIVNYADLRFQLFKRAVKPAALIVFGPSNDVSQRYRFDYWVPKADLNLKTQRVISLNSLDKRKVSSIEVDEDPFVFKRRFWMNDPESKLFHYLDSYPNLGSFIVEYKNAHRNIDSFSDRWVIGNGFKPAFKERLEETEYRLSLSKMLSRLPYMPIESFQPLSQNVTNFASFDDGLNGLVHRKGFERAFEGPRILVPQGISKGSKRLRAAYLEEPLTFEHIVLGISVPKQETFRAKLLTSLLNSKLMLWYAFHVTGSFGSDRPIIHQEELLRLPFPDPDELSTDSNDAAQALVTIIEEARDDRRKNLLFDSEQKLKLKKLDELCYRFFGLSNEEITLVEDTVNEVIPSAQPHASNTIELCQPVTALDRKRYVKTLTQCMKSWMVTQSVLHVILEASNDDLALLRIEISESNTTHSEYSERHDPAIGDAIERLSTELDRKLPGNFRVIPDFRMFSGKRLWLVKPMQRRFWLPSTAIADADSLAVDLQGVMNVSEVG